MKYVCSCCGTEFTDMKECKEHEDGCNSAVREVSLSLYDLSLASTIRLKQDDINYTDGNIIRMRTRILTREAERELTLRVIKEGKRHIVSRKNKIEVSLHKCDRALRLLSALEKSVKEDKENNER